MVQSLLLQQRVSYFGGVSCKVEILAYALTGDRLIATKGVIVEVIASLIKLLPKPVVGLLEVQGIVIIWHLTREGERIVLLEDTSRRLLILIAR